MKLFSSYRIGLLLPLLLVCVQYSFCQDMHTCVDCNYAPTSQIDNGEVPGGPKLQSFSIQRDNGFENTAGNAEFIPMEGQLCPIGHHLIDGKCELTFSAR